MTVEIKKPIYLDYQSTTPLDPKALDAMMMPYLRIILAIHIQEVIRLAGLLKKLQI